MHFIVDLIASDEIISLSAIILGYYIKVKRVLASFKAIFEERLIHKIYSLYPHLGGSFCYDIFHLNTPSW